MKFLFLFWIAIRSTFEASVWATAAWCILYPFSGILWLQCFWVFSAIQYVWNLCFIEYVGTHSADECRFFIRLESFLVIAAIVQALITSIIPTIAGVIVLKLISGWTHGEPNWIHVWLFVVSVAYTVSRRCGKRRMARPATVS
jgi:hypothetical protein